MKTDALVTTPQFLQRNLLPGIKTSTLLAAGITLLSLWLHLYHLRAIGDSNAYYTAAVESMTQSWHNFFFVAAEPGGSLTVDKPPLGLWIETAFAYFLGVSGFSTTLPNILAGVFNIPILYHLVKKQAGELAALIAALVMGTTPVYLAANRSNIVDGMLIFFLLLAALAFIRAVETGKRGWVLLGGIILGLGFNVKLMQAFLPLPAFYALYFFASKEGWLRKTANLLLGSALMLLVSFSWAAAVDLTPPGQRPFIGLSRQNTALGMIWEHGACAYPSRETPCLFIPPNSTKTPFKDDVGKPGAARFFVAPLSRQMSWLLPFVSTSAVLMFFSAKIELPLSSTLHQALVLWGGWLLACLIALSRVTGILHGYYAIMLVPPLAALVGIGGAPLLLNKEIQGLALSTVGTLVFQFFAVTEYQESFWLFLPPAVMLGSGILLAGRKSRAAAPLIFSALLVIPLYWAWMTVNFIANPEFPGAYVGRVNAPKARGHWMADLGLLEKLQANTRDVKYLLAVPSSFEGAPLVIATGRPVLYIGGFAGQEEVVGAEDLERMTANGELRYVLYANRGRQEIKDWLQTSCINMVDDAQPREGAEAGGELFLYRCEPPR